MKTTSSSDSKTQSLSVVTTCFNSDRVIESFLERVCACVPEVAEKFEIIVVDDGSQKSTLALLQERLAGEIPLKIGCEKAAADHTAVGGEGAGIRESSHRKCGHSICGY